MQCQSERGVLEQALGRAERGLQTVWTRARGEADGLVQGMLGLFRRREHDALQAATVQLEQLGVNVDLSEAGDDVGNDLHGCAEATRVRATADSRRRYPAQVGMRLGYLPGPRTAEGVLPRGCGAPSAVGLALLSVCSCSPCPSRCGTCVC